MRSAWGSGARALRSGQCCRYTGWSSGVPRGTRPRAVHSATFHSSASRGVKSGAQVMSMSASTGAMRTSFAAMLTTHSERSWRSAMSTWIAPLPGGMIQVPHTPLIDIARPVASASAAVRCR